ncbi:MAG: single-stranded-DNA-specific exonuclease RecJ [SAR324 cluster bacterium]|nr:single-stranded-DNA-specific exonuclease RecJ [SAR324 cluster bacterium]
MPLYKIWQLPTPPKHDLVEQLSQAFQLFPLVSSILIRRGYTTVEEVEAFLSPQLSRLHDPYLMRDMKEAVCLLKRTILSNKRIVILGDYDVDGITATTMMTLFLNECGCNNTDYFIPNRFEHGYGLTQASVDVLLGMKPDLVLTVDNGITAVREVQRLHEHGIKTLITDHHLPYQDNIPAGVILNPNHPDCNYPDKKISGCGVALKLLMAMRKEFRDSQYWSSQRPEPNLKSYLDLAALGTVADVVPLVNENRLLVYHGIKVMNTQPRFGIQALAQLKNVRTITSQTLAFQFAPLLNAAGRMHEASAGVKLLLSTDLHKAAEIAKSLDQVNNERRTREAQMLQLALEQAKGLQHKSSLVVTSSEFHEGISGIVAARLMEHFYKPAFVFAVNGEFYKGSARSIPELHIKNALDQCQGYLEKYGGHAAAAGCTIHQSRFEAFTKKFEALCLEELTPSPQPLLQLDGKLEIEMIGWDLIEQLELLQPFGAINSPPIFSIPAPQQSYQIIKSTHAKWNFRRLEIMGWNLAKPFYENPPKSLAVHLGINEFRGERKIQLVVQAFQ